MTFDLLSIREASELMGVSQLRVRELIRKGRLEAQKLTDAAGDRWTIPLASAEGFLRDRPAGSNGATAQPKSNGEPAGAKVAAIPRAAPAGVSPAPRQTAPQPSARPVNELVAALERQLTKIKQLAEEVARAQSYVDGLRAAQRAIESEVRELRAQPRASAPKATPRTQPASPASPKAPEPESAPAVTDPAVAAAPPAAVPVSEQAPAAVPVSEQAPAAVPVSEQAPAQTAVDQKDQPKPKPKAAPKGASLAEQLREAGLATSARKSPKPK